MIDIGVSNPVMVSFSLYAAVVSSTGGAHKAAPHSVHSALHLTRADSGCVEAAWFVPAPVAYGIR